MKDNLWWKMTFGGRRPLVEDDLLWKTNFIGRWTSVEDNLQWKRTFGGRRLSVEDDLQWKTTFGEDDLWWKITCSRRRPSVEDTLCCILACCLLRFAAFLRYGHDFLHAIISFIGLKIPFNNMRSQGSLSLISGLHGFLAITYGSRVWRFCPNASCV